MRRDQNERYYDLISAFADRTGVPVLLNTSFNENEPICCTPEEAVDTFVRTKMDLLVLGNHVVEKPDEAGACGAARSTACAVRAPRDRCESERHCSRSFTTLSVDACEGAVATA